MTAASNTIQQLQAYLAQHQKVRRLDYESVERDLPQQLGQMMRRSRSDLGWSQREIAEALSVSRAQYLRYEAGHAVPRLHTALQWSMLFGVPPSVLLSLTCYGQPSDAVPAHFFRLSGVLLDAPADLFVSMVSQTRRLLGRSAESAAQAGLHISVNDLRLARREVSEHDIYLTIGANLRLVRQWLNYSQEDMASGIGVSTSHFLAIERGDVAYSFLLMPRFAYAMQFPPLAMAINSHYFLARQALSRRFEILMNLLSSLSEDAQQAAIDYLRASMKLHQNFADAPIESTAVGNSLGRTG